MTVSQSNFIKSNWINFSTLVVVIGFVAGQSRWQQRVDTHIETFEAHKEDEILHMPFENRIQVFVPRIELDNRLKNIEDLLKDVREKLNQK